MHIKKKVNIEDAQNKAGQQIFFLSTEACPIKFATLGTAGKRHRTEITENVEGRVKYTRERNGMQKSMHHFKTSAQAAEG